MKNLFLLLFFLMGSSFGLASEKKYELTEEKLKKMAEGMPPSVLRLQTQRLSSLQKRTSFDEQFQWKLTGSSQWSKSKERLLGNFDGGVTQSFSTYNLGVKKRTAYGVEVGINAFSNKASNAFLANGATQGLGVSLSLDLFQNFLGKQTSRQLKKNELSLKRSEVEEKTGIKLFEVNLRRLYWNLVANNEQQKLFKRMISLSQSQLGEAKKRLRSGIADRGEVARYEALLAERKATLTSLEYQRGVLTQSLKELLPKLSQKKITLGKYNVKKTIQAVLSCSQKIKKEKKAPFKYTLYDEIIEYLREEEKLEKKLLKKYDGLNVRLTGEYNLVGRGFGYGASRSDLIDHPRPRKSLGLMVEIPLGESKKRTKDVLEKLAKARYKSQIESHLGKVKTLHFETSKMITLLHKVMKSQSESHYYLAKSLKESRKKYKQARLSVQELMGEEEKLVQSKYNEIQTQLSIINTLMDYFSVYGQTPCEMN